MIVTKRPSGLRLIFMYRGTILQAITAKVLITVIIAIAVTLSHGKLYHLKITMNSVPFSLIGLALAIFLGFRNNACYDRFWEGRKQWGMLIIVTRNLTRQILTLIDRDKTHTEHSPLQQRMVHQIIAFTHALRHHLRDSRDFNEIGPLLAAEEQAAIEDAFNRPYRILNDLGDNLRSALSTKRIDPYLVPALDQNIDQLGVILGACERIKNTPIPFTYTVLLHRTAYLYCFLLPFGLVDSLGFMTPFVVAIIAYTFFGLDALGDEIEDPFGLSANDLPLTALSTTIERDLRNVLGETELPPVAVPVDKRLY